VKIREIANIVKISTECIQNATQNIGHEKAIGEMGAAFAHSGTAKTESHDNFKAQFGHV